MFFWCSVGKLVFGVLRIFGDFRVVLGLSCGIESFLGFLGVELGFGFYTTFGFGFVVALLGLLLGVVLGETGLSGFLGFGWFCGVDCLRWSLWVCFSLVDGRSFV